MPVSASQHRTSTETYQNKLYENFRGDGPKAQGISSNCSTIPDEMRRFGSSINQIVNSHEKLSWPSYQNTAPRQGIAALLLMLSQVRLAGSPPSATSDNTAFVSGRGLSCSFSRNAVRSASGDHGFSAMLNPVANALYETGQFISRYDPLTFPVAAASPLLSEGTEPPLVADATQNIKNDTYVITDEQKKNNLISSVVKYLVSDGQLTIDDSADFELWLRSEAAGAPVLVARLDNEEAGTTRIKRALQRELDPTTGEHIKEHCAFEEEVLNASGENEGKLLLFQAQRAEEPFRMIYDNRDGVAPSPVDRGVAQGLEISTNILTLGIKPLIGNIIAHAKRREYYKNQGDEICTERYRRVMVAEVLTSLNDGGLSYQSSSRAASSRVKPLELLHTSLAQERAAFYTRNPHSGIRKEILLELKQGKGKINDSGRQIFLKPTKKSNEFVTHYPDAMNPERLERRVIVDENNHSWRYADNFDLSGLNVDISEGKRQIKLHGDYYELQQNGAGKYEIVVQKKSGIKEYIPVYMEPSSQTWHLSVHNDHPVFSKKQKDVISEIKSQKEEGFDYLPRGNNNQNYYGHGNIYVQEKMGDAGHYPWGRYIEMNGELVPVRNTQHHGQGVLYEVYDMKNPGKEGYPVEWDGNRWLFERKTSVHVSKGLKKLITPEMFAKKVSAEKLSAPDHTGLRYDADGNKYIKIKGEYLKLEQSKDCSFIRKDNGDKIYINYLNNKFKPTTVDRYNGIVSSSPSEVDKDFQMNSSSGLRFSGKTPLNEAWSLEDVKVRNTNFDKVDRVGSGVDVVFTMKYNKLSGKKHIEMPALEWRENIDFKEGSSKWHFQTDMYSHNPKSMTFFPWRNRYIEAYNFSKAKDKLSFNGNVKIYKNNMESVGINDIKNANSPAEMAKNVQDFLAKNGGVMEITITDLPQILKREIKTDKERKIEFNIGFNDEVVAHFSQGISLRSNGEVEVFVTTSDKNKLARGDINTQPPEIVTKPRDSYFSPGEVY